jgi:hypothetical protein
VGYALPPHDAAAEAGVEVQGLAIAAPFEKDLAGAPGCGASGVAGQQLGRRNRSNHICRASAADCGRLNAAIAFAFQRSNTIIGR